MFGGGIVSYTESSGSHFASLSYKYYGVTMRAHTHHKLQLNSFE